MKRTILLLFAALCGALTAAAQDLIVKTDATKIEAKVIEITPEAVRYKRFSNPDGPTYVLPVKEIHYIQYANGEKEYYTKTIPATPLTPATPAQSAPNPRLPDLRRRRPPDVTCSNSTRSASCMTRTASGASSASFRTTACTGW